MGIESPDNAVASQVVYNAAYLHANMAILFSPPADEAQWLSVALPGGTLNGGVSLPLTVSMDASQLVAPYTYTGTVTLTSSASAPISVPVQFHVTQGDLTPPLVQVACLGDVYSTAPRDLVAEVSDASGIAGVSLKWSTGGPVSSQAMTLLAGDFWGGTLPGQPAGTSVSYWVEAVDAGPNSNTGSSAACTYAVLALEVPDLTITPVSSSQVQLTWTAVPGAASYKVYRAGGLGGSWTLLTTTTATTVPVTVSPDQTRLLRVTAVSN